MSRKKAKQEYRIAKLNDIRSWLEEFQRETDRAAAVLGGELLNARLESLLRTFMLDDDDLQERLLGLSGPLNAFGARIDLAQSLGLLTPWEYNDLKQIQHIRNSFAHDLQGRCFEDQDINGACRELKIPTFLGLSGKARYLFELSFTSIVLWLKQREQTMAHRTAQPEHVWTELPSERGI